MAYGWFWGSRLELRGRERTWTEAANVEGAIRNFPNNASETAWRKVTRTWLERNACSRGSTLRNNELVVWRSRHMLVASTPAFVTTIRSKVSAYGRKSCQILEQALLNRTVYRLTRLWDLLCSIRIAQSIINGLKSTISSVASTTLCEIEVKDDPTTT